jgi:nicotinamidase/pyrazinamidase
MLASQTALIVVDAQRGFTELCPEELPIPGGLAVVPAINALLSLPFARIDATQDWHPPNHCSFFGQRDNLYPPHCVQGTLGAEFLPGLDSQRFQTIWRKGYQVDRDAYAVTAQHPSFATFLQAQGIISAVICGLALNICCFFTARDLRQAGLDVYLVEDASAGIDVPAAGLFQEQTRQEAAHLGISYVHVSDIRQMLQLV